MNPNALQGPPKELTAPSFLCKIGQETVQEIVVKTTEMMALIKTIQLPNGTSISNSQHEEKKNKLKNDLLKTISNLFKRLYRVREKCSEPLVEDIEPENLIPIEGRELPVKRTPNESIKDLQKEYDEQLKILKVKNAKLKAIIDRLREIVWEANTMLAMRGSDKWVYSIEFVVCIFGLLNLLKVVLDLRVGHFVFESISWYIVEQESIIVKINNWLFLGIYDLWALIRYDSCNYEI